MNTVTENYWLIYAAAAAAAAAATVILPHHVGYYFQSLKKTITPISCPVDRDDIVPLISSHRMPYKLELFCCVFWLGTLSTRHPWRAIGRADVYTHKCFWESMGLRFGSPGQKALPSMNEFTLVDFSLIPLSETCSFDVPAKNL